MRNSRSHPILHDFEDVRSHNPTKLVFLASSPRTMVCTREIASLTDTSSHEELNWPETFWRNHTAASPTVG